MMWGDFCWFSDSRHTVLDQWADQLGDWRPASDRVSLQAVLVIFYLSIYGIYIAPLQGNYSEALPGPGENESFKELVKRAGQRA